MLGVHSSPKRSLIHPQRPELFVALNDEAGKRTMIRPVGELSTNPCRRRSNLQTFWSKRQSIWTQLLGSSESGTSAEFFSLKSAHWRKLNA